MYRYTIFLVHTHIPRMPFGWPQIDQQRQVHRLLHGLQGEAHTKEPLQRDPASF